MTKRNKIIYWIATLWLALGMLSTGIVQLLKMKEEADMMAKLGYPVYMLTILGIWKILGVIAILVPKFALVKEWAYAGFLCHVGCSIFSFRRWRCCQRFFRSGIITGADIFILAFQTGRQESRPH